MRNTSRHDIAECIDCGLSAPLHKEMEHDYNPVEKCFGCGIERTLTKAIKLGWIFSAWTIHTDEVGPFCVKCTRSMLEWDIQDSDWAVLPPEEYKTVPLRLIYKVDPKC